jgi:hypothetical protein
LEMRCLQSCGLFTRAYMTKRILTLFFAISFASVCAVQAQAPMPGESPAGGALASKTAHAQESSNDGVTSRGRCIGFACCIARDFTKSQGRSQKKADAGTTASPTASPPPAASPVGAPKAKGTRKKAQAATSPSPSPAKFSLGDLFKPRSSAAASPGGCDPCACKEH